MSDNLARNLRLSASLTSDEATLVRFLALKNGLIHNIPRSSHAYSVLRRKEFWLWKPHGTECDIFELLKACVADEHGESSLQFSPEFDGRERWIAQQVAESMGLEHELLSTSHGCQLKVWKERDIFGKLSPSFIQRTGSKGLSSQSSSNSTTRFPPLEENQVFLENSTVAFDGLDSDAGVVEGIPIEEVGDDEWSLGTECFSQSGSNFSSNSNSDCRCGDSEGSNSGITQHSEEALERRKSEYGENAEVESNADKEDPQPSAYDNIPFSRQISDRVIHETATLRARASYTSAKRITTGTGEVYEVRDGGTGERAIFKPAVEKSHRPLLSVEAEESRSEGSNGRKNSFGYRREVAAYQLDHFGFSGVLPTVEVEAGVLPTNMGAGVLQSYKEHEQTADEDEWGRREILRISAREVHKIGILDIRLFNEDRHGGNLLIDFSKAGFGEDASGRLIPIDHEYVLPECKDVYLLRKISLLFLFSILRLIYDNRESSRKCDLLLVDVASVTRAF